MNMENQSRSGHSEPGRQCHAERSEESRSPPGILSAAKNDIAEPGRYFS